MRGVALRGLEAGEHVGLEEVDVNDKESWSEFTSLSGLGLGMRVWMEGSISVHGDGRRLRPLYACSAIVVDFSEESRASKRLTSSCTAVLADAFFLGVLGSRPPQCFPVAREGERWGDI